MKTRFNAAMGVAAVLLLFEITVLAQKPELVLQTGHTSDVSSVSFHPNGNILASAGGEIKLWDIATGKVLRTIFGHSDWVPTVNLSPDGNLLATVGYDNTIKLWNVVTGGEVRTLVGNRSVVLSIVFSPNGRFLAGVTSDEINLWEVSTGKRLRTMPGYSIFETTAVSFSPDSKLMVYISDSQTIRLANIATGRVQLVRTHADRVVSVNFSPDGKLLASASFDGAIKLWEVATGKIKSTLAVQASVGAIAFSADSKLIASSNLDGTTSLWNVETEERRTLGHRNSTFGQSISLSPDGKFLASGGAANSVKLWDLSTARELDTIGDSDHVTSVSFSRDSKLLANGSQDGTIKLWNLETGKEVRTLRGSVAFNGSLAFSPDGNFLANGSSDNTINLWDIATGTNLRTLAVPYAVVGEIGFSPDSRLLASGRSEKTTKLWDIGTGTELLTVATPPDRFTVLNFSPDGKTLVTVRKDKTIKLVDILTGKELRTLTVDVGQIHSVAVSPNGRFVACGDGDEEHEGQDSISLWDVSAGKKLKTISGYSQWVFSVNFSLDNKLLASGSEDGTIKLWDVATGKEIRTLAGHSSTVRSIAFSRDRKLLASGSDDGTTKLWDVVAGKEIANVIAFNQSNWVVLTPDGHFDTNDLEEIKNLQWVFSDDSLKPLPPEIFMRQYYEPRLLPRLLQNKSFEPLPPLASLNRVQPEVKIRSIVPAANSTRSVKLTVDVGSASGVQLRNGTKVTLQSGVYDLRLFRDGQLVSYVPGKIQLDSTGKATIEREVKLPGRPDLNEVEFTAYAFNSDQVKSATSNFTYKPAAALPAVAGRAYIISVGVNAYEDRAWDLSFAARDARVSEETLTEKLTATGEYEVVPLRLTSEYQKNKSGRVVTTKLATRRNFQTVLDLLAHGPEKIDPGLVKQIPGADRLRKVEPEDLVLVNFSSHGYTDKRGKFYLVPYDTGSEIKFSSDGTEIAAESLSRFISSDDLSEWVRDIDAGELVMIIDTCHSAGAVEEPGFKPGPMGSRGMGQLAYDKGMRILAASQADDVALEIGKLQQGILTYALMQDGLGNSKADKNGDGRITLDEWLGYGAERVPALYDDVKTGRVEALKSKDLQITAVLSGASVKKNAFQQPQLFDFKRKRLEVLIAMTSSRTLPR